MLDREYLDFIDFLDYFGAVSGVSIGPLEPWFDSFNSLVLRDVLVWLLLLHPGSLGMKCRIDI